MKFIFNLIKNFIRKNWKKYGKEILLLLVSLLGANEVNDIVNQPQPVPQAFERSASSDEAKFSDDKNVSFVDFMQNLETGEFDVAPSETPVEEESEGREKGQLRKYDVSYYSTIGGLPGGDKWSWKLNVFSDSLPSNNDLIELAIKKADQMYPGENHTVKDIRTQ